MEVYFVRHGETVLNLMDKMQGWSDSPLTDKGIEDLKKTGQYLKNIKFDALYSSDLKRTMDTAEIIINENKVSNLKLQTSKNFREIFFGSFEGYGREYRERLLGSWGIVDVNDCCNCAKFLVTSKN